jgi:putative Mn2+ efflux pump MntP
VDDEQGRENTEGPQQGKPWGFYLVLAAIVLVTVVFSVTMVFIGEEIRDPATAIGAMTATFAVIGTLVGTYFGIKAGLDGQDKVKETF